MPDDLPIGSTELRFIGASRYADAHPELDEAEPRIYVKFRPQGAEVPHLGLLDTGGHYCVLTAEIADSVADHLTESLGRATLRTAHGLVSGDLYIHTISFIAEVGEPLDVDAVMFVSPDWRGPSILGYTGVLDRILLALNPRTNRYFFGPPG